MQIFKRFTPIVFAALFATLTGCAGGPNEKSTGEVIDDAAITAKVKTALIRDDSLDANDINVETYKGTVQLSGFVDNESDIDEAEELASNISGVRDVQNDLRFRGDN